MSHDAPRSQPSPGGEATIGETNAPPRRIAVVVNGRAKNVTAEVELAARRLGCDLRRFEDAATAMTWLRGPKP